MAVDVEKRVQTTFTVVDRATAAIGNIGRSMRGLSAITNRTKTSMRGLAPPMARASRAMRGLTKSSQRASRATDKTSRSIRRMGRSARGTIPILRILGVTLAAFSVFRLGQGIAKLGDNFEQTRIQLAGFIQGLGFTGDFNKGLMLAEATIERIRRDSADLPGEAEDYLVVFKRGLPFVQQALGGSLSEMVKFTNTYTAITNMFGTESAQAARDLQLMLTAGKSRATLRTKSLQDILPFMEKLKGHAKLTRKEFQAMTQVDRAKVLIKAFGKLDDMLKAARKTFDAQWGGFKSNMAKMAELASKPIFKGMTAALLSINRALLLTNGQWSPMAKQIMKVGEVISKAIVGGISFAVQQAKALHGWFSKIVSMPGFSKVMGQANAAIGRLTGGPKTTVGGAAGTAAGGAAMFFGASGPIGLAIAGIVEFATRADAVANVLGELSNLGLAFAGPLHSLIDFSMQLVNIFADMISGILPGLIAGFTDIIGPVLAFAGGLLSITANVLGQLRPAFIVIFKSIGSLFRSVGKFLSPVIRILGSILLAVHRQFANFMLPILKTIVHWLGVFRTAITMVIDKVASVLGGFADKVEAATGERLGFGVTNDEKGRRDFLGDFFAKFKVGIKDFVVDTTADATAPKTPRVRGGTIQDFRYSRFQIDQKFAEGFDPDRIAVAFARDLGRIGEQKLQSGFEPLFAIH